MSRMTGLAAVLFALTALPAMPAAAEMSAEAQKLRSACTSGSGTACIHLGVLHRYGLGVPQDPRQALTLFVEACERGYALACAFTGDMAYLGAGVAASPEHGEVLMRRACATKNEWACETLYRHGLAQRPSPQS